MFSRPEPIRSAEIKLEIQNPAIRDALGKNYTYASIDHEGQ
jgi:hypothetical protein